MWLTWWQSLKWCNKKTISQSTLNNIAMIRFTIQWPNIRRHCEMFYLVKIGRECCKIKVFILLFVLINYFRTLKIAWLLLNERYENSWKEYKFREKEFKRTSNHFTNCDKSLHENTFSNAIQLNTPMTHFLSYVFSTIRR